MTGVSSSCGACKFLRRKCTSECVFTPYFSYDEATTHFAAVHKIFGASNVSRLLMHLPQQWRSDAALSITYEALARRHDPVYGCVAYIYALQQEVANLQEEVDILGKHMHMPNFINVASEFLSSHESNNLMYNSICSQEIPMNLQDCWKSTVDYQQEQIEPKHTENGSCNSLIMNNCMSELLSHPILPYELQRQGDFHGINGSRIVEGVLNVESFETFPWLLN